MSTKSIGRRIKALEDRVAAKGAKSSGVRYPKSACEEHLDVSTSEPVCIVCMANEIEAVRSQHDKLHAALKKIAGASRAAVGFRDLQIVALQALAEAKPEKKGGAS